MSGDGETFWGSIPSLMDWRRRVFELYAIVRMTDDPNEAWEAWRAERDDLFARHPQSPIQPGERRAFHSLPYFDYDPAFRVAGRMTRTEPKHVAVPASGEEPGGTIGFIRFGRVEFELSGQACALDAMWLDGYGGGLFLPFRDATAGTLTYGAGRYLLDTVKGSDLGVDEAGDLVLDFNFAYNPSCSYDPRWVCPLAPPGNRLAVEVPVGERHPWTTAP